MGGQCYSPEYSKIRRDYCTEVNKENEKKVQDNKEIINELINKQLKEILSELIKEIKKENTNEIKDEVKNELKDDFVKEIKEAVIKELKLDRRLILQEDTSNSNEHSSNKKEVDGVCISIKKSNEIVDLSNEEIQNSIKESIRTVLRDESKVEQLKMTLNKNIERLEASPQISNSYSFSSNKERTANLSTKKDTSPNNENIRKRSNNKKK